MSEGEEVEPLSPALEHEDKGEVDGEAENDQTRSVGDMKPLSNEERRRLYFELNQCKAENETRATEVSILKRQLMQLLQLVHEASSQSATTSGTGGRAGNLQKVVESLAVSENRLLRTILQDVRRKHSEEAALMQYEISRLRNLVEKQALEKEERRFIDYSANGVPAGKDGGETAAGTLVRGISWYKDDGSLGPKQNSLHRAVLGVLREVGSTCPVRIEMKHVESRHDGSAIYQVDRRLVVRVLGGRVLIYTSLHCQGKALSAYLRHLYRPFIEIASCFDVPNLGVGEETSIVAAATAAAAKATSPQVRKERRAQDGLRNPTSTVAQRRPFR